MYLCAVDEFIVDHRAIQPTSREKEVTCKTNKLFINDRSRCNTFFIKFSMIYECFFI